MSAKSTSLSLAVLLSVLALPASAQRGAPLPPSREDIESRLQNVETKLDLLVEQMEALQKHLMGDKPAPPPVDEATQLEIKRQELVSRHNALQKQYEEAIQSTRGTRNPEALMFAKSEAAKIEILDKELEKHLEEHNVGSALRLIATWFSHHHVKHLTKFLNELDNEARASILRQFPHHVGTTYEQHMDVINSHKNTTQQQASLQAQIGEVHALLADVEQAIEDNNHANRQTNRDAADRKPTLPTLPSR